MKRKVRLVIFQNESTFFFAYRDIIHLLRAQTTCKRLRTEFEVPSWTEKIAISRRWAVGKGLATKRSPEQTRTHHGDKWI